jgi:hypothetical protein
LERRFLLVCFLPTLIFVWAVVGVWGAAGGQVAAAWQRWTGYSFSTQLTILFAALIVVWLAAGFLDSQLRNLTQLYEGYTLLRLMPRASQRATAWHRLRRAEVFGTRPADSPTGSEGANDATDEYVEETFVQYPDDPDHVMPTRLGNAIRSAEEYSKSRYDADYLLVWPRLAHMCTERFVADYEGFRSAMQFSMVVSFFSGLFVPVAGVTVVIRSGPLWLFLLCVAGGAVLAYAGYATAVTSAGEWGEQIRASVDLFRNDLLRQLRYALPDDVEQEKSIWCEFEESLRLGVDRKIPYFPSGEGTANQSP